MEPVSNITNEYSHALYMMSHVTLTLEIIYLGSCMWLMGLALQTQWYKRHRQFLMNYDVATSSAAESMISRPNDFLFLAATEPTISTMCLREKSRTFWLGFNLSLGCIASIWLVCVGSLTSFSLEQQPHITISGVLLSMNAGACVFIFAIIADGTLRMKYLGKPRIIDGKEAPPEKLPTKKIFAASSAATILTAVFCLGVRTFSPMKFTRYYHFTVGVALVVLALVSWYSHRHIRTVVLKARTRSNTGVETKGTLNNLPLLDPHHQRRKYFLKLELLYILVAVSTSISLVFLLVLDDHKFVHLMYIWGPIEYVGRTLPICIVLPRSRRQLAREKVLHCDYEKRVSNSTTDKSHVQNK